MQRRSLVAAAAIAVLATACTAGKESSPAAGPKKEEPQTITLWHGWTADSEVAAFDKALAGFKKKFPHITVQTVKGTDDDKIIQAVRSGNAPDVASSFTYDNVGQFCKTGIFQDLTPYLTAGKVNLDGLLPKAVQEYTQYKGTRCVMPLLADAYGLYYNKALMKGKQPPRTLSELAALAKELTVRDANGDIQVAGFVPLSQYYENVPIHIGPMTGARWHNPDGTSAIGSDPAWQQLMTWQKELIDWFGYDKLEKFRKGLGQEFSADNPFHKGKVAMAIDGEWRTAMLANDAPSVQYGTAPVPVADDKASLYGGGYIAGTIIGIPKGSKHPEAAWELVRYLTTDTEALVSLSNDLRNVPSTIESLQSPNLKRDANFQTFLDIFNNPNSSTMPAHINGAYNQQVMQEFMLVWESGRVKDLAGGLKGVDQKINDKLKLTGG